MQFNCCLPALHWCQIRSFRANWSFNNCPDCQYFEAGSMFCTEMTHSEVPAVNLMSPAGARTSKRKGPHSDTQTGFALLTSTEELKATHPILLSLWRRKRGHRVENQPLLHNRLDLHSRQRLSDLHPHLQLATGGFTSIHHLWNTWTILDGAVVSVCVCNTLVFPRFLQSPRWSLWHHSGSLEPRASAERCPPLCLS